MRQRVQVAGRRAIGIGLLLVAACAAQPQPALENSALSCSQANDYTLRVLQAMYFQVLEFEPAVIGRPGTVRARRKATVGFQNVTVTISCTSTSTRVDAHEEGLFARADFTRDFYTTFTAMAADLSQHAGAPPDTKRVQVLLEPVTGPNAKIDLDLDPNAAGVLPVRITIKNVTARAYKFDPNEVILTRANGARVRPLSVAEAAQQIAAAEAEHPTAGGAAVVDAPEATRRLEKHLLGLRSVPSNQTVKGYLFYPAGKYTKGRVTLEEEETGEAEGFIIEM